MKGLEGRGEPGGDGGLGRLGRQSPVEWRWR
jgi:hypothetical protein